MLCSSRWSVAKGGQHWIWGLFSLAPGGLEQILWVFEMYLLLLKGGWGWVWWYTSVIQAGQKFTTSLRSAWSTQQVSEHTEPYSETQSLVKWDNKQYNTANKMRMLRFQFSLGCRLPLPADDFILGLQWFECELCSVYLALKLLIGNRSRFGRRNVLM